jgi:hypothetical protein
MVRHLPRAGELHPTGGWGQRQRRDGGALDGYDQWALALIYTELGAKRTAYNLILATGAKEFFSKDSNVQRMVYPNSCG